MSLSFSSRFWWMLTQESVSLIAFECDFVSRLLLSCTLYVCMCVPFILRGGGDEDWGIKRSGALCGAADGRSWDSKCDHVWLQWCTVSSLCKDQGLPEKNVSLLIRNVQQRVSNDDLMVIFILKNDSFTFDTRYSCHLKMELLAVFWAAFGQHVSKWTLSLSFNDLNTCNLNTERS